MLCWDNAGTSLLPSLAAATARHAADKGAGAAGQAPAHAAAQAALAELAGVGALLSRLSGVEALTGERKALTKHVSSPLL
jgi:hypothetical protein